jgi:hypothetical protein
VPAPERSNPSGGGELAAEPAPVELTPEPAPESEAAGVVTPQVVRRRNRGSRGARFLSFIFKAIAILIWIGSVMVLVGSGTDMFSAVGYGTLFDMLDTLLSDNAIVTVAGGFLLGLIVFGIGSIIGLLGDIRRNTR